MASVAIFVSGKRGFFITPYCINCRVDEYCAFPGVDMMEGIDEVLRTNTNEVARGVRVSNPVPVKLGLPNGEESCISVSHTGIIALFYFRRRGHVFFLDLTNDRKKELDVRYTTSVGFYDDYSVILTIYNTPVICSVNHIFGGKQVSEMDKICDVKSVSCFTDVTRLQSTRELFYNSLSNYLYKYNVDTKINKLVAFGCPVTSIASLTGINLGIKAVINEVVSPNRILIVGKDDLAVKQPYSDGEYVITTVIPSFLSSELHEALRVNWIGFYSKGNNIRQVEQSLFHCSRSIVRLYREVFMIFVEGSNEWCLVRIQVD